MKNRFAVLVAAVAMTSAGLFAQPDGAKESPTTQPVVEKKPEASESPFFAEIEATYVTAYYSRGYNFGDKGLLLQPQVTAGYTIYDENDLSITPWGNVWANVTDKHYEEMDYFDELDLTGGVDFTYKRLTLSPQYIYYTSPADNFGDIDALGLSASFDDSDLYGCPVGLRPFAALFHEIDDEDGTQGTCLEVGIKPAYTLKDIPLTISMPITVGLNVNDFYFDENGNQAAFGYWSAGLKGRYDLTDNWFVTASVTYVQLTADSTQASNHGEDNDVIGSASVGYSF